MYREVNEKYPGGITTILDPNKFENEDDNQVAMLLVETYLAREGLPVLARHLGKMWRERMNRHVVRRCAPGSHRRYEYRKGRRHDCRTSGHAGRYAAWSEKCSGRLD